jgi:hypothetical protein
LITLIISGVHAYVETKLAEKHSDSYLPENYVYINNEFDEETIVDTNKNEEQATRIYDDLREKGYGK